MPFNSFLNYPMSWKPERSRLKRPIYRSLAEQMEKDIATGFLPPGTRLPPQRELADFLDINFTTVTRAYRLCELKGLIYAVTGSGTFVAPNAAKSVTISADTLAGGSIDLGFVSSFEQCNNMISDTIVSVIKKRRFAELLDYEYPTGMPHHKAAAVNWLGNLEVHTDPDHLALASGTLNAIALALFSLFEPGNRIAVDTYAFVNFIELAKMHRLQLVPISGDEEGMLAEELEAQHRIKPIHGVFLSPSCCNPTTIMITERRKAALADVIGRCGMILIEDDIHAFLSAGIIEGYAGPISRFLPDQFVYICGTSKSLCSGLRVAYLVYPDRFREQLLSALFNINVKTSSLDAEVITELILSGKAGKITEKKHVLAEEMNALFYEFFPEQKGVGHPLSFYRWLPIQDTRRGSEVERELLNAGICVYHSDRFLSGPREGQCYLRISLATVREKELLKKGLTILAEHI